MRHHGRLRTATALVVVYAGFLFAADRPRAQQTTTAVCQPFPFIDEASTRPDFLAFRRDLIAAIDRRDIEAVIAAAAPEIRLSFGGDHGPEQLRKGLVDRRELWDELRTVLTMGGTWKGPDQFVAPYVFSAMPDTRGGFDDVVIIGANVRIRSAPRVDATVLTTMSHCLVALVPRQAANKEWTPIALGKGRRGWVSSRFVRSQVDYRAIFEMKNGRWWMTFFAAGD